MRSVRRGGALALAALALAAAGCQADPGTVAYVGGAQVSQQELDTAVAGVQQTLEPGQQVATAAVVNVLIHGQLAEQIAAARRITVTDAQRDKVLAGSNLAPLLEVPAAKEVAYDVATQQLVAQRVGAEAYLAEVAKTEVRLNPRFGQLNPQDKTVVDGTSGSLSVPAEPPTG
jgi:hypothetical protein